MYNEHPETESTLTKWGRRVDGGTLSARGTTTVGAAVGGGHLYGAAQILSNTPKAHVHQDYFKFHALSSNADYYLLM